MDTAQPTTDTPEQTTGVSRRTIVAGAAWAVPAVIAVTATPAFAVSGPSVTMSAPNSQAPAEGAVTVTAIVRDASGARLAGQAVSFTGPSGSTFSPATVTTNSAGTATSSLYTSDKWATPGSTITVTALSNGVTGTAPLTILGANAYVTGDTSNAAAPRVGPYVTTPMQVELAFPSPIVSMATFCTGSSAPPSSFAVLQDGTAWSIGDNSHGQLGDGTATSRNTWAKIPALTGVVQIVTMSGGTVLALLADGAVRGWGYNGYGVLNDGTTTSRLSPVTIPGLGSVGIRQLAGGKWTAYALAADGTIRAWGAAGPAAGVYNTQQSTPPVTVSGISTATQIAAINGSGHALLNDGTIRSWGWNGYGQLGDGSTTTSYTPVTVAGITTATQITAGDGSVWARLSDGTIRAWGFGQRGQLGDGASSNSTTPVTVAGITTAVRVATIGDSAYALLADGTLRSWGWNHLGQLGDGTLTDRPTPVSVTGVANVTTLTDSDYSWNTFFIRGSAAAVSVAAASSQVPAGGSVSVSAVVRDASGARVSGQTVTFTASTGANVSPTTAMTNSAGAASTTFTTTDVWATPGSTVTASAVNNGVTGTAAMTVLGANAYLVGDNRSAAAPGATSLTAATQLNLVFPSPIKALSSINVTSSATPSTYALLNDGTLWSIGNNTYGQLGDGTTTTRNTWARVAGLDDVVQIATLSNGTVLALIADGTVRGWGLNDSGQLNDGTATNRYTPVTISGLGSSSIQELAGGQTTAYARLANGTVRQWGYDPVSTSGTAPTTVSGITTATRIAASVSAGYALLSDGTVRAWGTNNQGQLGDGTTNASATPVTVAGVANAVQIAAGFINAYARLADGTIRAWGYNASGQLGDGTLTRRTSPITVTGIATATLIGTSGLSAYAQLNDGTIQAWGNNTQGQLGDGTTTRRTTPVTLIGAANVTAIASSTYGLNTLLLR